MMRPALAIPGAAPGPQRRLARGTPARRPAFTLAELVVSMGIMSVLLTTIASALVIASKALPSPTSITTAQAQTTAALDRMAADLACATAITELTATAITVTVADRGHGASGPESIRWAWSGVSGTPLTRQYNTSTPQTIAPSVSAFSLSPTMVVGHLSSAPRVLMVVNNPGFLSSEDNARIAKLAMWAFPTTLISSSDSQTNFNAAFAACDVVYVTTNTYSFTIVTRFNNPAIGIVNENDALYPSIGMSTLSRFSNGNTLALTDNTHEITTGFPLGAMSICTSPLEDLHGAIGILAPGARSLGIFSGNPALAVIDISRTQSDSQIAAARRVVLPWGGSLLNPFAFTGLKAGPRTILKRALVWAAAPPVYDRIRVTLTAGTAPTGAIDIELFNQPGVPRP